MGASSESRRAPASCRHGGPPCGASCCRARPARSCPRRASGWRTQSSGTHASLRPRPWTSVVPTAHWRTRRARRPGGREIQRVRSPHSRFNGNGCVNPWHTRVRVGGVKPWSRDSRSVVGTGAPRV
eukprot:1573865-Prymnesium_polylepis.1